MKRLKWLTPILAVLIGLAAQPAGALVLSLSIPNAAIAPFPGPYGTVTITRLNAVTATIAFASNSVGPFDYLFGDGGSVGFNVNAASFTTSAPTFSNSHPGFLAPSLAGGPNPVAGVEDGFGSFNTTYDMFDGYTRSITNFSTTITNLSGTWATDADVLTANAGGFKVAAHIFVAVAPATRGEGALATGFAADGAPTTPEPTTVVLLGLGFAGAGGLGIVRRRRQK